jgi:hypothetical protein
LNETGRVLMSFAWKVGVLGGLLAFAGLMLGLQSNRGQKAAVLAGGR